MTADRFLPDFVFIYWGQRITVQIFNDPVNNNPTLDYLIAFYPTGDDPLCEPVMPWFIDEYMLHSVSMNYISF